MRRLIVLVIAAALVMYGMGIAAEQTSKSTVKAEPIKAAPGKAKSSKITRMHASGVVVEVTEGMIRIERAVKGNSATVETMQFILEKPVKVNIGDKVTVSYVKKDNQDVAIRVTNAVSRKKADVRGKTDAAAPPK
ncbi:MAG: hypothetical protein CVU61_12800 [Deltaproteobacteria bacterium HGW-Deltaproteobacteria-19]|nr:MAG: hypothetical protein CVU61_12800 [Deltaproteobacteria bacterium HGW-Deltaproteobacteria-19]